VTSTSEITEAYNELISRLQTEGEIPQEAVEKIKRSLSEHHKRQLLFLESSMVIIIEMLRRYPDSGDIANRMLNAINRLLISGSDFSE
jgi:hypothetical protein